MRTVNHLRILMLAILAALLVSGLLDPHETDTATMDTIFTLAFLGYVWYLLRRNANAGKNNTPPGRPAAGQEPPAFRPVPTPPKPFTLPGLIKPHLSTRVIQHTPPWTIVERGQPVGYFRHLPIPAWIRTSAHCSRSSSSRGILP